MSKKLEIVKAGINIFYASRGVHVETFNHHHIAIDYQGTEVKRNEIETLIWFLGLFRIYQSSGWSEEHVLTDLPKKQSSPGKPPSHIQYD